MTPVENAAQGPPVADEEIHGQIEKEHGHWVIEETQDVDRVNSVRRTAHEEEDEWRDLKYMKH